MNIVSTDKAPAAIGPYSQAVKSGKLLFCSGQIALDPETGQLVDGDIKSQVGRVLENVREVLAAAGCKPEDVVKTVIFLVDMDDFPIVNELYAGFFGEHKPARSTVAARSLPRGALVEIEVIAECK